MRPHQLIRLLIASSSLWASSVNAIDASLVGTWSTKSAKVFTGPRFYNPINDSFIEPENTGISFSFTADGFFEQAYYRAVANPTNPKCPFSVLQFQHGTFTQTPSGGLSLTPFSVDGRELISDPCAGETSTYKRYSQSSTLKSFTVSKDAYTGATRLDLYEADGAPMNPMFLAYSPPQMLPTIIMNPTAATAAATATGASRKREVNDEAEFDIPLNKHATHIRRDSTPPTMDPAWLWWTGLGMTVVGAAAYML